MTDAISKQFEQMPNAPEFPSLPSGIEPTSELIESRVSLHSELSDPNTNRDKGLERYTKTPPDELILKVARECIWPYTSTIKIPTTIQQAMESRDLINTNVAGPVAITMPNDARDAYIFKVAGLSSAEVSLWCFMHEHQPDIMQAIEDIAARQKLGLAARSKIKGQRLLASFATGAALETGGLVTTVANRIPLESFPVVASAVGMLITAKVVASRLAKNALVKNPAVQDMPLDADNWESDEFMSEFTSILGIVQRKFQQEPGIVLLNQEFSFSPTELRQSSEGTYEQYDQLLGILEQNLSQEKMGYTINPGAFVSALISGCTYERVDFMWKKGLEERVAAMAAAQKEHILTQGQVGQTNKPHAYDDAFLQGYLKKQNQAPQERYIKSILAVMEFVQHANDA